MLTALVLIVSIYVVFRLLESSYEHFIVSEWPIIFPVLSFVGAGAVIYLVIVVLIENNELEPDLFLR